MPLYNPYRGEGGGGGGIPATGLGWEVLTSVDGTPRWVRKGNGFASFEEHFLREQSTGFFNVNTAGSASVYGGNGGVAGDAGVCEFYTGSNTDSAAWITCRANTSNAGVSIPLAQTARFECRFKISSLPLDGDSDDFRSHMGFFSQHGVKLSEAGFVGGAMFFRQTGDDLEAVTRWSGSETATTVATVAANTYYECALFYDRVAGTVKFWVGDVLVATHSTNVDWSTYAPEVGFEKLAGTNNETLFVDYVNVYLYL